MRRISRRSWAQSWLIGLLLIWPVASPRPTSAELTRAALTGLTEFNLQSSELAALESGGIVARPLATAPPRVIAAQGLAVISAAPADLLAMYRSLDAIRLGGSVVACGRFRQTPDLADVAALPVSTETVAELRAARLGDSSVKLCEAEIKRLQTPSSDGAQASRSSLAEIYRQMLWKRALAYAAQGQSGLPPYADKRACSDAQAAYAALFSEQAALSPRQARLCQALRQFPRQDQQASAESFLYWAVQKYGDLKPVTSLVQIFIWRDGERAYVASTLVYANHYAEAGLVIAELIPFASATGQTQTLIAYTARIQTDLLGGQFSFLKKKFAQAKLVSTVRDGLASLQATMASGALAARGGR